MTELRGKRILITGAARGLGLATARRMAAEGAEIVLADRDADALEVAVARLGSAGGFRVRSLLLDVTDSSAVLAARDRLDAETGGIDVLVNGAGVVHGGTFARVALEHHLHTYSVNLLGLVTVTHAFLPGLVARTAAHVVNIASASGFLGLPFGATYASSKWGVIGFSESLRRELEVTGHGHVKVTTVCPGYVDTGMFAGVRTPRATPMLDPDDLAGRIVRAVRRDRPFLLVPWTVRLVPLLRGIVPTRALDRIVDAFAATRSMEGWRGRGDEP